MDVTRILESDHREAEDLFAKIEKAEGAKRQPMIDKLVTALRGHMELEETVVYPKMAPATGADAVTEGETEHQLARKTMEDVVRLAPDEPGFGAALDALKAEIEHHVKEEEGEVFPKLRSKGEKQLEEMATPFMQERIKLGMPIDAAALEKAANKDELVAEAKSASVDGADGMSKSELAEVLASNFG